MPLVGGHVILLRIDHRGVRRTEVEGILESTPVSIDSMAQRFDFLPGTIVFRLPKIEFVQRSARSDGSAGCSDGGSVVDLPALLLVLRNWTDHSVPPLRC